MYIFFHLQKCNPRMSQQETFMDKYIFEGFSHQWPYNTFVLGYLVQQNEEYMGGGEKGKKKEIGLDASLIAIFLIFPIKLIMNILLITGDVNVNRL